MQDISSILNIIFIIGGGVVTFIILFIFAKRQISRFALRSRRGPHVPIGADAKKCLKKEIERRIEAVPRITHEPRLLSIEPSHYILEPQQPYHYRFRAVDDVKTLEDEISRHDPGLRRHPRESLRAFLLTSLAASLDGHGQKLVHQFCDTYEYARHHPGQFGEDHYLAYSRLLKKLLDAAKLLQNIGGCGRSPHSPKSPQRRPQRPKPANKHHKHYTALENLPVEPKLEDEIITIPICSPELAPNPDETSV